MDMYGERQCIGKTLKYTLLKNIYISTRFKIAPYHFSLLRSFMRKDEM